MKILESVFIAEQNLNELQKFDYLGTYSGVPVYIMEHVRGKGIEKQLVPILSQALFSSSDTSLFGIISHSVQWLESILSKDYRNSLLIKDPNEAIRRNFVLHRDFLNPHNTSESGRLFLNMIYGITPPFLYDQKITDNSPETVNNVYLSNKNLKNYLDNPDSLTNPYLFITALTTGFKPMHHGQFTGYENLRLRPFYKYPYKNPPEGKQVQWVPIEPIIKVADTYKPSEKTFDALVQFQLLNN